MAAVRKRGDLNNDGVTNAADIDNLGANFGNTAWKYDFDVSGWPTPNGANRQDADVLIRTIFETDYGDSDLNGRIDFDDYSHIDSGFNNHLAGWANGDFDGNGHIDFDDYALIDLSFNTHAGALARAMAYLDGSDRSERGMSTPELRLVEQHLAEFGLGYANAFLSAVPEPSSADAPGDSAAATTLAVIRGTLLYVR